MSAQDFYKQFFIKLKKEVKNVLYQNMEFYILNWVRPILSLATTWPHWPGSQASQQKTREGGSRRAQNIAEITTSSPAAEDIILLNSEHLQHHHSTKMLCEDQLMSVDNTPQKGSGSLNSSASSISIDVKPQMQSWAQEVRAEFGHSDEASSSFNSSAASCGSLVKKEPADIKLEPADVKLEPAEVSADREMAFEFLDGVNEEKFERLVKEEKLKTPYKRRHSQTPPTNENSRSNSPNSSSNSSANGDVTAATRNRSGNNSRQRQSNFRSHKEEKRLRHNSYTSSTSSSSSYTEADAAVLARRQKQIDYGKNTAAYERYAEMVPKAERGREHPRTPNKYGKYSRRAFDGLVKIWRKSLHVYDPPTQPGQGEGNNDSDSDSD